MLGQKHFWSLGQIIEETMHVTEGLWFKSLVFNDTQLIPEGSGELLKGHHSPLIFKYQNVRPVHID